MSVDLNRTKTRDAARGHWYGILTHFGIDESFLRNIHGPCPCCGGKNRFRWDNDEGNGTWYCNGCTPQAGSGLALLMNYKAWPFDRAAKEVDAIIGNVPVDSKTKPAQTFDARKYMGELWKASKPIKPGDPAWIYLQSRCGDIRGLTENLRFHPGISHTPTGGTYPALLSMMRPTGADKNVGIHRTYLTPDGHKALLGDETRMSLGEVAQITLGPVMPSLGYAEGIETALCAAQLFHLPVWSAVNAGGLCKAEPPEVVEDVHIFGDNDASYTGQAAAYALAKRLYHSKRFKSVTVHIPETVGTDWADVYAATRLKEAA